MFHPDTAYTSCFTRILTQQVEMHTLPMFVWPTQGVVDINEIYPARRLLSKNEDLVEGHVVERGCGRQSMLRWEKKKWCSGSGDDMNMPRQLTATRLATSMCPWTQPCN
jgi:hypothetical protein